MLGANYMHPLIGVAKTENFQNVAVGVKTFKTVQHRFPATVIVMLHNALIIIVLEVLCFMSLSNLINFGVLVGEIVELGIKRAFVGSSIE